MGATTAPAGHAVDVQRPFVASNGATLLLAAFSLLSASGCGFDRDGVRAGYYGPVTAGSAATVAGMQQNPITQAGSPASNPSLPMGAAGTAAGAAGTGMAPVAGSGGIAAAGQGGSAGGEPTAGTSAMPPSPCDLSGRWISTLHYVTDALDQLQTAHTYVYYEIEQQGDAFQIKKGLQCGDDAVGSGVFAATANFKSSWAAAASRISFVGRMGKSVMTSGGCMVELQKWYTVRGATLPYYTDPSKSLPSAEQMASGTTPGWEDWDGDGNPGITGIVESAIVSGKVFVAPRQWTAMAGTVPAVTTTFKLPLDWNQEANVMAYDDNPLLASEAVRAADPALHFAQFARLSAEQASGDDAAICNGIIALAPMLTPEAAGM
jgi:hypothetical protein